MSEEERRKVLEMVENGQITPEQGLELLNALQEEPDSLPPTLPLQAERFTAGSTSGEQFGQSPASPEPEVTVEDQPSDKKKTSPSGIPPGMSKWRNFLWIPLWVGIGITVLGGLLMLLAYLKGGFGFWFACAWFPFLLGVAVLALTAASRTARWVHVRVTQPPGEFPQKIAISLPIPIRLTAWGLKVFGKYIPENENINLDEMVMALEHVTPEAPLYVEVDEGDGERVEVYIG